MSPGTATHRPNPSHVQAAVQLAYIQELLLATEIGLTSELAPASCANKRSVRTRAGVARGSGTQSEPR